MIAEKFTADWFKKQVDLHVGAVGSLDFNTIAKISDKIAEAFANGNKLLLCGNGGSAADSQHIAGEFAGKFRFADRRPYPAISLPINRSILTALAND